MDSYPARSHKSPSPRGVWGRWRGGGGVTASRGAGGGERGGRGWRASAGGLGCRPCDLTPPLCPRSYLPTYPHTYPYTYLTSQVPCRVRSDGHWRCGE